MNLEIALGAPSNASYFIAQSLGQHYTRALVTGPPQMSCMTISDRDIVGCNARGANNAEIDQILNFPALPNIAVNGELKGRSATVCFRASEFGMFFPNLSHSIYPYQRIIPLVDALIYSGEYRIAITLCTVRRAFGATREVPVGCFAIWHCSNIATLSYPICQQIIEEVVAWYCAAQFYLTQRPVQVVYAERRSGYGIQANLPISEPQNSYTNPPTSDTNPRTQLELVRRVDLNPEPTSGDGRYVRKCPVWQVAGHWRESPNGGQPVWVNPYRKGPERNNPDFEPATHEYVLP